MHRLDPEIARSLDFLRANENLLLAVLFGSAAHGTQTTGSDIDIAVYPGRALTSNGRYQIAGEIAMATGRAVDLIDLSDADGGLLRQILRGGIILFSKHPAILGFLTERLLEWQEDFEPQLNALLESRLNRFTSPAHGS